MAHEYFSVAFLQTFAIEKRYDDGQQRQIEEEKYSFNIAKISFSLWKSMEKTAEYVNLRLKRACHGPGNIAAAWAKATTALEQSLIVDFVQQCSLANRFSVCCAKSSFM